MPEQPSSAEIAALEEALTALSPAPVSLDRDRLMFRAGQAVASRGRWRWPASTAALAVVASALGAMLAFRAPVETEKLKVVEKVVYVKVKEPMKAPTQPKTEPDEIISTSSANSEDPGPVAFSLGYFQLQDQLLKRGLDGLPSLPPAPAQESALSSRGLLDRLGVSQ
jgi:hypothetical protein